MTVTLALHELNSVLPGKSKLCTKRGLAGKHAEHPSVLAYRDNAEFRVEAKSYQ